jgi:predicted transcriptional regulator
MTKEEIKAVLERVQTWPRKRQAELVRIAVQIEAQDAEIEEEDEATKAAVAEGLAQAKQGRFVSDRRVKATWKKFGL